MLIILMLISKSGLSSFESIFMELRISLIKIYVIVHPNDYDYDDEKGF